MTSSLAEGSQASMASSIFNFRDRAISFPFDEWNETKLKSNSKNSGENNFILSETYANYLNTRKFFIMKCVK